MGLAVADVKKSIPNTAWKTLLSKKLPQQGRSLDPVRNMVLDHALQWLRQAM
jgi:hypothetical protein